VSKESGEKGGLRSGCDVDKERGELWEAKPLKCWMDKKKLGGEWSQVGYELEGYKRKAKGGKGPGMKRVE